jgi:dihydroxyacetone kinase
MTDVATVESAVSAGLEAIVRLGKAELGDKTMIDAAYPFLYAMRAPRDSDETSAATWRRAASRAAEAADRTANLVPRIGRARPLAERSVGHPDAGAISFALIVSAIGEALK